MSHQPLLSLLMPVKNAERYLEDCLQSIRNQSYSNWELLAVNNFSTDQSHEILLEYALKDERIKVFQNTKNDLIQALRMAVARAQGTLVSRMDADDLMHPDKLHLMVKRLRGSDENSVVVTLVKYFSENQVGKGFLKYEKWLNTLSLDEVNFEEIYKECVIPSPSWLMHKNTLLKIGAFSSSAYPEDYDLCFRMYKERLTIRTVPVKLHFWRDYSSRASRVEENYNNQLFLPLKWRYFKQLERQTSKELLLWGAGLKAKSLSKLLIADDQSFSWVTNNAKKVGKNIYGIKLAHYSAIRNWEKKQIIILVSSEKDQNEISTFLKSLNLSQGKDYTFFC